MPITYPPTNLAMLIALIGVMLMLVIWEVQKLVEDISPDRGAKIKFPFLYAALGVWFITSLICGYILIMEPWLTF